MTAAEIRALIEAHADEFADWVMLARAAGDECEEPARRAAFADQAGETLDGLAAHLAAALAPPELTVEVRPISRARVDYVLITARGHLGEASAPQLREALNSARTPGGYRSIAIDLTGAVVHGRKGLSPLVGAFLSVRRTGEFYLVAGSKMEQRVLGALAGGSLKTYASVAELDEALDAQSLAGVAL